VPNEQFPWLRLVPTEWLQPLAWNAKLLEEAGLGRVSDAGPAEGGIFVHEQLLEAEYKISFVPTADRQKKKQISSNFIFKFQTTNGWLCSFCKCQFW
jgi:hypothetical protein